MEYYKFLFIILIFTLFSHSFSEKQENHNSEIQKLHQFLEEPETESENTNEEEEEEEEDFNENEEEEEGDNHKKEEEKENNKDYDNGSNDSSFVNVKCLWVNKYNVYSLQKLQLKDDDYKKGINNNELVIFNFCQNTNTKSELESTALWQKNNKYIKIAGSIDGKTDINRWDEIHDDTGDKGLFITLAKGEECQAGINHQTFLRIVCDENNEKQNILDDAELLKFNDNSCSHTINIKSIYGCALTDLYLLKKILNKYWYLFGFALIILGGFLCFYGHKIIWATTIIVSGLFFCFIISILFLNFLPSLITTESSLWILLGVGLLVGIVIGIIIKNKTKLFACLLGASMGYSVALFVYQIVQSFIEWNPQVLYYITIGVCIILGILFGLCLYNSALIIGTTILGGYITMRGVSTIFGEYIDEGQFVDLIKNGEIEQLKEIRSGWTFAYLGLWLILIVGGVFVQCRIYKKSITN